MPSKKKRNGFNKQRENEKRKRQKRKIRLIIAIILIGIIGIVVYLLNSPTFNIKNIEVTGNEQINDSEILDISGIKVGKSIFSNFDIITKVRLKQNGYIEDAKVSKKMPDTIKIEIQERIPCFQIKTENEYYIYIDEQGYIIDYSQEPKELITIIGMEITEEDIEKKKRLEADDLNTKLENILHIKEETTKIEIYEKIVEIQVENDYLLKLDNFVINLGNATNLKERMDYVKTIIKEESGKSGTINVNGNLNEGFIPYFTEKQ